MARARVRTIPTERPPLVGEVSTNFCHMVSVTDPYGRILDFLDRFHSEHRFNNFHYTKH
jgi:hypothetical protein